MNIFKKIGEIIADVGEWLLGIGNDTLHFAKGILVTLASNPEIQAIASSAVKEVEEAAMAAIAGGNIIGGSQKLEQAQSIVISGLQEKGLPIVMNAINIAIEAAVANMKKGG